MTYVQKGICDPETNNKTTNEQSQPKAARVGDRALRAYDRIISLIIDRPLNITGVAVALHEYVEPGAERNEISKGETSIRREPQSKQKGEKKGNERKTTLLNSSP